MKPGDPIRIEYIRPGKEITYYEEDLVSENGTRLETFKTLPTDIVERLSNALQRDSLIGPEQRVHTIKKVYFLDEPFNLLEFRDADGNLLGHYSDIGEPVRVLRDGEYQMTDLYLDIWLHPNGKLIELDWDEFEEAIQKQVLTSAQAELARVTMQRLVSEVAQGIYPDKYLK